MADAAALTRAADDLPPGLPRGGDVPEGYNPLSDDGILMAHQKAWLEDQSRLKVCEKGRRTGLTFAEMLDATLIAATQTSAGGQNYFYIGDTKEKGQEAIGYVAHFARVLFGELGEIEEFMETNARGEPTGITAYRVRFASGHRVEALSSNPANIRGLQGTVLIDEAAFHGRGSGDSGKVREVIDAVNALLIWGGKVRVISTHFGALNAFNELVREGRSPESPWSVHRYTFDDAVENGLYALVCLRNGWEETDAARQAWYDMIRASYGPRVAQMRQELDAIPADMQGSALSRVQIEACMAPDIPFLRWIEGDAFRDQDDAAMKAACTAWCETHVEPVLETLDPARPHFMGEDFARSGDATDIVILEQGTDLVRRTRLLVELRNMPFKAQWFVLDWLLARIPNFRKGAMDKTGNGAFLAEEAARKYGARIEEVTLSRGWYELHMPPFIEAFTDRSILLPRHEDVLRDHQALVYVNGIIRVPENFRFKGSDGLDRHGDSAIATALGWYASTADPVEYDYRPVRSDRGGLDGTGDGDGRGWWQGPLGARLRGGGMF